MTPTTRASNDDGLDSTEKRTTHILARGTSERTSTKLRSFVRSYWLYGKNDVRSRVKTLAKRRFSVARYVVFGEKFCQIYPPLHDSFISLAAYQIEFFSSTIFNGHLFPSVGYLRSYFIYSHIRTERRTNELNSPPCSFISRRKSSRETNESFFFESCCFLTPS